MYRVTKTFGGFPCAHRNHRHKGHCAHVHGYSIRFDCVFASQDLTKEGFVVDFGSLAPIRDYLTEIYDHRLVLAEDDPLLDSFLELQKNNAARLTILASVAMEYRALDLYLRCKKYDLPIESVTCYENEKNAASYS